MKLRLMFLLFALCMPITFVGCGDGAQGPIDEDDVPEVDEAEMQRRMEEQMNRGGYSGGEPSSTGTGSGQ